MDTIAPVKPVSTEAAHTPGPWYYSPAPDCGDLIIDKSGNDVARVERVRDMALICSAPDMLAALNEVRTYLALYPDADGVADRVLARVRAVMDRAEGR